MPDGDVVSSSIQHHWRSAYYGLRGGAPPDVVAPRALRALTRTLRLQGGIAGLQPYASVVEARAAGGMTAAEARAEARLIARSAEQTKFALAVHAAVDQWLAAPIPDAAVLTPGVLTVAEAVCLALMDVELFEPARPVLVGESIPDHDAYDRYVADCRALIRPALARVGESLSQEPSATRLRAVPTRRGRRKPMAVVLGTSLLS